MYKRSFVTAALGMALGAIVAPASAVTVVTIAPPPPRVEVVPAPRRGYVWVPGYWSWSGRRHVWVQGNWVRERRGYVYESPQWVERDGRWELRRGAWRRGDRDGDGVPNRLDSRPDNPRRP